MCWRFFVRSTHSKMNSSSKRPPKKNVHFVGFFLFGMSFCERDESPSRSRGDGKSPFCSLTWRLVENFSILKPIGNTFILIQIMDFPAKTSCEWVNSGLVSFSTFSPPHPVLQHPANSTQSTVPTPGHLSRDEHPTKNGYTPRKLTWNLKINGCKMTFPFWGRISYFQGRTVSLREGNWN